MSKKSCNRQSVMGVMVPGMLLYDPCCKNKKKKNRKKIKKLICREIEFKENSSSLEKAKVINEREREIVESLYKREWPGLIIKSIRFSVNPGIDDQHVHICAKVRLAYMMKEGTEPPEKDRAPI